MFKKTLGFNVDKLKRGTAIEIEVMKSDMKPVGVYMTPFSEIKYEGNDLSGNYLIKESSPTILRTINEYGKEIDFHFKYFGKEDSRMKIRILS